MLAVLPKGHPLCGLSEIPPAALRGQQLLIPAEGLRYDLGDILRRAGMEGEADSIVSDYAALSLVRQGCGITILPRLLLDEAGRHGTEVRHIAGEPKRVICLASLAHQSMSPAAAAFCRYVQEWTAENGQ